MLRLKSHAKAHAKLQKTMARLDGERRDKTSAAAKLRAAQAAADRDKHELALLQQIRLDGLPEPKRNYPFAAKEIGWSKGNKTRKGEPGFRERLAQAGVLGLGDWRADFAWPEHRILVEIEGGLWMGPGRKGEKGGRHIDPRGYMEDMRKYREAAALGWRVFRFSGDEVHDLAAIRFLEVIFERMDCSGRDFPVHMLFADGL